MAANIGSIMGRIGVDTVGLRSGLRRSERMFKNFTSQTTTSLRKISSSIFNIRNALVVLGGTIVFRKVISEFVAFEDALLDLQKVMTDSEGSADQFIDTVDELSSTFATASSEVLQGAANFKQAGFAVEESFQLQEKALKLARISQLEVVEGAELIVAILKGFKAPASEAERAIDAMNAVSNKYATSLKQLAIGMSQFSPIAKLMGFTFEETIGLITPIVEVFRSGSEAGNALKFSLLRLVDTNAEVVRTLESIGVSQTDLNGKLRSGKDILIDVQKAFQGMDRNMKVFIASQLAGSRQAGRMLEVFNGLAKVSEITAVAIDSVGSANKELAVRLNSTGVRIDRMKISFNNLARSIGGAISPAVIQIMKQLEERIKDINERLQDWLDLNQNLLNQRLSAFINVMVSAFEAFSRTLKIIGDDLLVVLNFLVQMPDILKAGALAALALGSALGRALFISLGIEAVLKTFPVLWNLFIEAGARGVLALQKEVNKLIDLVNRVPLIAVEKVDVSGQEELVDRLAQISFESLQALDRNKTLVKELIDSGEDIKKMIEKIGKVTVDTTKNQNLEMEKQIALLQKQADLRRGELPSLDVLPGIGFEIDPSVVEAKRKIEEIAEAFKNVNLKSDIELQKVAENFIKNFRVLEKEAGLSAARLEQIWQSISTKVEPLALDEKTLSEFRQLEIKFGEVRSSLIDLGDEAEDTFNDRLANAVEGWASGFSGTLTDMLHGTEVTFQNIAKEFSKMITQMIIQWLLIEPMIKGLKDILKGTDGGGGIWGWLGGGSGGATAKTSKLTATEDRFTSSGLNQVAFQGQRVNQPESINVSVPVSIEGGGENKQMIGELQRNIEEVVVKTIKEFV